MGMPNEYSFAIDADHVEMTKFINKMDTGYRQIVFYIQNAFSEACKLEQLGKFNKRLNTYLLADGLQLLPR